MTSEQSGTKRYAAPALEKGLDILELLSEQTEGMAQSAVARSLERTPSEIFRMLNCLERRGYLHRSKQDDLYRLTPRVFELAHRHPPTKRMLEAALPLMRELARNIGQSCHLAIHYTTEAMVVAKVDNPGYMGFAVRVGARAPLNDSCSGFVILAHQDEQQTDRWLTDLGYENGSSQRSDMMKSLAEIREAGCVRRESSVTAGITDIGAPILDHRGSAEAALTSPCIGQVGAPPDLDAMEAEIRRAAKEISRHLGG